MPTVLLALVLTSLLSAQTAPTEKKFARIDGKITHAKTGEPLRKVNVTLFPSEARNTMPRATTTTAEGAFTFDRIEPGRYQLRAERTGFLSASYSTPGSRRPSSLELTAGQQSSNIELKLMPHGVVAGKVLDGDGDPIQRVQVSVLRISTLGGKRRATMESGSQTNDLGEFRIYSLPAGRYYVRAERQSRGFGPGPRPATSQKDDYVPTFYPGSVDTTGATVVEVEAGQEAGGLIFQLRRSPTFAVRGKVVGAPSDVSPRNMRLFLAQDRDAIRTGFGPGNSAVIRNDASFEFLNIQPGSYQVVVSRPGRRTVVMGRVPITVSTGDIDGLTVTANPPVVIAGVVRPEKPGAADVSKAYVTLSPSDGDIAPELESSVKPDGTFQFDSGSRERYTISVSGVTDGYVRAVKLANQDVTKIGLDLTSVGGTAVVEIIVGTSPGTLDGTVADDGKPAIGATVTLIPEPLEPMQPYLTRRAATDANGAFRISAVAPGQYRLFAWEEIRSDLYNDPEFLKKYENAGKKVTVKEAGAEHAELTLVRVEK